jgi:hypothetical protein
VAWRRRITEVLADYLQTIGWGAFLLNGILLALASVYIVAKFLFFLIRFLDRTLFAKPW